MQDVSEPEWFAPRCHLRKWGLRPWVAGGKLGLYGQDMVFVTPDQVLVRAAACDPCPLSVCCSNMANALANAPGHEALSRGAALRPLKIVNSNGDLPQQGCRRFHASSSSQGGPLHEVGVGELWGRGCDAGWGCRGWQ